MAAIRSPHTPPPHLHFSSRGKTSAPAFFLALFWSKTSLPTRSDPIGISDGYALSGLLPPVQEPLLIDLFPTPPLLALTSADAEASPGRAGGIFAAQVTSVVATVVFLARYVCSIPIYLHNHGTSWARRCARVYPGHSAQCDRRGSAQRSSSLSRGC